MKVSIENFLDRLNQNLSQEEEQIQNRINNYDVIVNILSV